MNNQSVWVGADFEFPYTYSIKSPLSSRESSLCLPAPGPATIRLALLKTAIEFFGLESTRKEIFPVVRELEIRIRPPRRVAVTLQVLSHIKYSRGGGLAVQKESLITREYAVSDGTLTIYVKAPTCFIDKLETLFRGIGYWGEGNSFTQCVATYQCDSEHDGFAQPLVTINKNVSSSSYCSIVSDFANSSFQWEALNPVRVENSENPLKLFILTWPMQVCNRFSIGYLLSRIPF